MDSSDEWAGRHSDPRFAPIHTKRLRLRPLEFSDAEDALLIMSRPEVAKWTSRLPFKKVQDAERWLKERMIAPHRHAFAIELREPSPANGPNEPKMIGSMGCHDGNELGYLLNPDFHGHGYATEALHAYLAAFFARHDTTTYPDYNYVQALTDVDNAPSQAILRKCGFTRCEILLQHFENPNTGLRDTAVWRVARPGFTLEDLGMGAGRGGDAKPPTPPVQ